MSPEGPNFFFFFLGRAPPLCQGLDDRPPPPPPLSEGLDTPLCCYHRKSGFHNSKTGQRLSSRILESEKAIPQTTIILLNAQVFPHLRAVTVTYFCFRMAQ